MIFREDGIWVTEPEREYLLRFGVNGPGQYERQIFEAALPGALKVSDQFTDKDMLDPDHPFFGRIEPNDRCNMLSKIGELELKTAGIKIPDPYDTDIPEDNEEEYNMSARFRLPISLAPSLVKLFTSEYDWHQWIEDDERNTELAKLNAIKLLSIIPPSLREKLFGKPVYKIEDLLDSDDNATAED